MPIHPGNAALDGRSRRLQRSLEQALDLLRVDPGLLGIHLDLGDVGDSRRKLRLDPGMRGLKLGVFFGKAHILVVEKAEHDDGNADRHREYLGLNGELIPHAGDGVPDLSTRLEPLAHVNPFAFLPERCPAADGAAVATFPISVLSGCRFAARDACPDSPFATRRVQFAPDSIYGLTRGQTTKNRAPRPGFLSWTTVLPGRSAALLAASSHPKSRSFRDYALFYYDLGADAGAAVKVYDILVHQTDAARRHRLADRPPFGRAVQPVAGIATLVMEVHVRARRARYADLPACRRAIWPVPAGDRSSPPAASIPAIRAWRRHAPCPSTRNLHLPTPMP